uniref:Uncharacterized protein n=1 Tax=Arion vulgaris TaxID=1028688 RepID=A0A0B6ZU21_9EUPU
MTQPQPAVRNERQIRGGHHRIIFGLGVLFIGTLIHTVGTITRGWISYPEGGANYGIFSMNANSNGALISIRAFTILGIILGVGTLILTGLYMKVTTFLNRRKLATCILVTGIGAGGSSLIGALIFALEFYFMITVTDKNYSFVLCIVGGVLLATGSILVFLGARLHMKGSYLHRSRIIIRGQISSDPSAYQGQDETHVWHTQFTEPPPSYNQLELSQLPPPKQQPSEMLFDTLPPPYSEAVKWYPKT